MPITRDNVYDSVLRLEVMKQATIINYFNDIDVDSKKSLYDEMIKHFVAGEFDSMYDSFVFQNKTKKDCEKIQALAHKYISLCFCNGDFNSWLESFDGVSFDYELICKRIFDNYDFLLLLASKGGEDALLQLEKLASEEIYNDKVIVDYLRNKFMSDSVLSTVLLEMSREDSLYDVFTDSEKAMLFNYSEGTLYYYDDFNDKVKFINPINLSNEINYRGTGNNFDVESESKAVSTDLKKFLGNINNFREIVQDIHDEYINGLDMYPIEVIKLLECQDYYYEVCPFDLDNSVKNNGKIK